MTASRRSQVRRALEVARKLQADRAAARAQSTSASSDADDWIAAIEGLDRAGRFWDEHGESSPADAWEAWLCTWSGRPYPPGRNDYPSALGELHESTEPVFGPFPRAFGAHAVSEAWTMAETPMHHIPRDSWALLWDQAGYVVDGAPAPRRRRRSPVRLYRVALPEEMASGVMGLSWTPDLSFANELRAIRESRYGRPHVILTTTVDPRDPETGVLLAEFTATYGRGEPEIVADIPAALVEVTP